MQTKQMFLALVFCCSMIVPCQADPTEGELNDLEAVEQATNEFYRSLNVIFAGDVGPMFNVWSHEDDITYMGPTNGMQIGWDEVSQLWASQAALGLGGEVLPKDIHLTVGSDLAVVICREVGGNIAANGEREEVSIRATSTFRKENGAWKMIGHHTDLLPFLEDVSISTPNE